MESIVEKYKLKEKRHLCEIKFRNCVQSDDTMVQVICDNRLIAVGVQRRTDFNNEEYTLIDLEHVTAKNQSTY